MSTNPKSSYKVTTAQLLSFLPDTWLLPVTKIVLKYSGPARAGLLLKWEKEREKQYRKKAKNAKA